jgi:hypothetical protein
VRYFWHTLYIVFFVCGSVTDLQLQKCTLKVRNCHRFHALGKNSSLVHTRMPKCKVKKMHVFVNRRRSLNAHFFKQRRPMVSLLETGMSRSYLHLQTEGETQCGLSSKQTSISQYLQELHKRAPQSSCYCCNFYLIYFINFGMLGHSVAGKPLSMY